IRGPDIATAELADILVPVDLHHQPARGNGTQQIREGRQREHFGHVGSLTDASTIERRLSACHSKPVSRSRRAGGDVAGQFEGELAAHSWAAVDEDLPAMGFGNLLHDVQPDAEADQVAGRLALDAGESLEELALVL